MSCRKTIKQKAAELGITDRAYYYRKARGWRGKQLNQPGIWPKTLGGRKPAGHVWDAPVSPQRWAEIRWALELLESAELVAVAFPDVPKGAVVAFSKGHYDRLAGFDSAAVDAAYQALDKDNVRGSAL